MTKEEKKQAIDKLTDLLAESKIDAGIPNTIADVSGLVFQNSLMS